MEMNDLVALLELGAAENDEEIVADAEASLSNLVCIAEKRQLGVCYQVRRTPIIALLRFMPVLVELRLRTGL